MISFGTSAASVSDGESEGGEWPGNTWLLTPAAVQQAGNPL